LSEAKTEAVEQSMADGVNKAESVSKNSQNDAFHVLTSSSKIAYEHYPMLEVILDRFVRRLTTSMRNFVRANSEISVVSISAVRFGPEMEALSNPAMLGIFRIEGWRPSSILVLSNDFIFTMIDYLLGGGKFPHAPKGENKAFTTIEMELIKRSMKLLIEDFRKSFSIVHEASFDLETVETNPSFAMIIRPRDAVVRLTLRVTVEERAGEFSFLIPYETLEPAREKLLQTSTTESDKNETKWKSHLSEELKQAHMNLRVELTKFKADLKDLLSWKEGDTVPLEIRAEDTVYAYCGNRLVLSGKMGKKHNRIAVQVEDNHILKRTDLDDLIDVQ
jgi:flagellar motor switch protein FliM